MPLCDELTQRIMHASIVVIRTSIFKRPHSEGGYSRDRWDGCQKPAGVWHNRTGRDASSLQSISFVGSPAVDVSRIKYDGCCAAPRRLGLTGACIT